MFVWFVYPFLVTFIIVRAITHTFHKINEYPYNRTVTGYLRRKTGRDIHHIHFGIIVLTLSLLYAIFYGLNNEIMIFFGMSLSLIADQVLPYMKIGPYFGWKGIINSVIMHITIGIIFYLTI